MKNTLVPQVPIKSTLQLMKESWPISNSEIKDFSRSSN